MCIGLLASGLLVTSVVGGNGQSVGEYCDLFPLTLLCLPLPLSATHCLSLCPSVHPCASRCRPLCPSAPLCLYVLPCLPASPLPLSASCSSCAFLAISPVASIVDLAEGQLWGFLRQCVSIAWTTDGPWKDGSLHHPAPFPSRSLH